MKTLSIGPIYVSLCLFLAGNSLFGQDPQFSQFFNNTMYYNPAVTGIDKDLRVSTAYRDLWKNIPGDLATYFISVDYQLTKKPIGLGLLMFNDQEGLHNLRTQRFETFFSYRFSCMKGNQTQLGISIISLNIRDISDDGFVFVDQLNPVHGVVQESSYISSFEDPKVYADWNFGFVTRQNFTRNRQFFMTPTIGFSVSHLTRPNISLLEQDVRLPFKVVAHANVLTRVMINREKPWKRKMGLLNPGFIWERQGEFQTTTVGSGFDVYPVRLGAWFRNTDYSSAQSVRYNAIVLLAGVIVPLANHHNLIIDYTYDTTISHLEFASGGAHEIMVIYNLSLPEKKTDLDCPVFNEWWRLGKGTMRYTND